MNDEDNAEFLLRNISHHFFLRKKIISEDCS